MTAVLLVVLLLLIAAFIWFFRYSRTEAWWMSSTRKAFLEVMVAMAPFLGGSYKKPRPQLPGIMTPSKPEEQNHDLDKDAEPRED